MNKEDLVHILNRLLFSCKKMNNFGTLYILRLLDLTSQYHINEINHRKEYPCISHMEEVKIKMWMSKKQRIA